MVSTPILVIDIFPEEVGEGEGSVRLGGSPFGVASLGDRDASINKNCFSVVISLFAGEWGVLDWGGVFSGGEKIFPQIADRERDA